MRVDGGAHEVSARRCLLQCHPQPSVAFVTAHSRKRPNLLSLSQKYATSVVRKRNASDALHCGRPVRPPPGTSAFYTATGNFNIHGLPKGISVPSLASGTEAADAFRRQRVEAVGGGSRPPRVRAPARMARPDMRIRLRRT